MTLHKKINTYIYIHRTTYLNIKLFSLNCSGLASREKRQDLFTKFKEERCAVLLLQEVHWDEVTLIKVNEEWGYKFVCAPFTTQAIGTAISLNNALEFSLGDNEKNKEGNFSLRYLKIHIPNKLSLIIGSVSGPNNDNPNFYEELDNAMKLT